MTTSKTSLSAWLLGALLGAALGAVAAISLGDRFSENNSGANDSAERKPLYWVAPMDPNYKRDKPGKSPMGMDLIPVYEDSDGDSDSGPGTVKISPEVVNNLGVRTAEVTRSALHSMIRTVGYVQYDEDRLVHIHPRVQGWIEKLYVKAAGDPVLKDQALYELYSPELVNAQEELLLALNRKNETLVRAATDRLIALQLTKDFISSLSKTRQVSQTVTFYAPQDGFVDNLNIREGFFVMPGTTLMSIGVLDEVWVEAEVFERQAALVEVGMPVTMTLDYQPGREWQGRVDYVYPSLDEKTRTLRVRLKFSNTDSALRPNMFVQVVMHAAGDRNTLTVPGEAVIRTGQKERVVLALGDGRFKSVEVSTGQLDESHTQILGGLSEGDLVVTSAQFLLDSESSKTSDFQRMLPPDQVNPDSAWAQVEVVGLMPGHRMVTVSHEAIPAWEWPAMTMDFTVNDDVDFDVLRLKQALYMQFTRLSDGQYVVSKLDLQSSDQIETSHIEGARHD